MTQQYDFKKEWPKIKKRLMEVSQEATRLAKKGEDELIRFSQKSKMHVDVAALNLKKEKLYYQIGKEYIRAKCPAEKTAKLKGFIDELQGVFSEEKALLRKIKAASKKTAKAA